MSYMRGDPYIYSGGDGVVIHTREGSVVIDDAHADAFALMRLGEMMEDHAQLAAALAVVDEEAGNFGGTAINRLMGGPAGMDVLRKILTNMVPNRRDEYEVCGTCGTFLGPKKKP